MATKPAHKPKTSKRVEQVVSGSFVQRSKKNWRSFSKKKRAGIVVLSVVVALFTLHNIVERLWQPVDNPVYGTSFSYKYATELGNNWQDNYTALLDDLQIKHFRLMSYWDLHEQQRGTFDFSLRPLPFSVC